MDSGIRQEETKTTLAMVNIGEFSTVSKNSPSGLHWSCDKFQCPNKILQSDSMEPCDFIRVSHYIRIMIRQDLG